MSKAIDYYESHAELFARQAANSDINRFEYNENMPALLAMTRVIRGPTLDFGCGPGNFSDALVLPDRRVSGCDASETLVNISSQNYPSIRFFQWDGLSPEPNGAHYNLIMAKLVFHYVDDLNGVLKNLSGAMGQNGHLCLSVPHPNKTQLMVDRDADEAVYTDEVGSFGLTLEMIHRSFERYVTALGHTGLRLAKKLEIYDGPNPKRLNILAIKT